MSFIQKLGLGSYEHCLENEKTIHWPYVQSVHLATILFHMQDLMPFTDVKLSS